MNKEEIYKKFERNVAYLHRNIPPDDIYLFTEQTFMAALYFIHKLNEHVDILEECNKDPVTKKWVSNILGFELYKDQNIDIQLDLDLKAIDGL